MAWRSQHVGARLRAQVAGISSGRSSSGASGWHTCPRAPAQCAGYCHSLLWWGRQSSSHRRRSVTYRRTEALQGCTRRRKKNTGARRRKCCHTRGLEEESCRRQSDAGPGRRVLSASITTSMAHDRTPLSRALCAARTRGIGPSATNGPLLLPAAPRYYSLSSSARAGKADANGVHHVRRLCSIQLPPVHAAPAPLACPPAQEPCAPRSARRVPGSSSAFPTLASHGRHPLARRGGERKTQGKSRPEFAQQVCGEVATVVQSTTSKRDDGAASRARKRILCMGRREPEDILIGARRARLRQRRARLRTGE